MINALKLATEILDRFSLMCGKALSWLLPLLVLTVGLVVLLRYVFNLGFIALQELSTYLHASAFLLAIGYTAQQDGHVRVDIFYRQFSKQTKAWVNAIGGIVFLLPISGLIFGLSLDFAIRSWSIQEISSEPGGIPAVFLLKTLLPLSGMILGLQAIGDIFKNTLILLSNSHALTD